MNKAEYAIVDITDAGFLILVGDLASTEAVNGAADLSEVFGRKLCAVRHCDCPAEAYAAWTEHVGWFDGALEAAERAVSRLAA